jgi:membrane protein YdbS with pleckstrin-like domain
VNKNLKLALFLVGATVFNLVLMFAMIFALGAGLIALLGQQNPPQWLSGAVLFVVFIGSIVLSFLIYGKVMKWLQAKYNLDKHFPQLFNKKKK